MASELMFQTTTSRLDDRAIALTVTKRLDAKTSPAICKETAGLRLLSHSYIQVDPTPCRQRALAISTCAVAPSIPALVQQVYMQYGFD